MYLEKRLDNIDTTIGLKEIIKDFIDSIELKVPFEGHNQTEELEFWSRSGFAAFNSNRGGFDLINISNISHIINSGEHIGKTIQDYVDKIYKNEIKDLLKEVPQLKENYSDEFYNELDSRLQNEYNDIAWRVRIMYNGNKTLTIYAGYDKDAPYFRWREKADIELVIRYKTLNGLKRQLKDITEKIIRSQLKLLDIKPIKYITKESI